MIDRIRLVNFKNHADTQIELGKLTALIGPNSSGKTNVLQALRHPSYENRERVDSLVRHGQTSFQLVFDGVSDDITWRLSVEVSYNHSVDKWGWSSEWTWGDESQSGPFLYQLPEVERVLIASYLKVVGENLSAPSYKEDIPPHLESDGSGLASVVAYLMTHEPEHFADLVASLRSIVPSVERVRVRPARINREKVRHIVVEQRSIEYPERYRVIGHELIFDMTGAQALPAKSISEGTLLVLGLLALLWSPDCPNLVLLDDIEQGLHPKAQRELIGQLRKILEQRPELQIVLTSHSPYIVDELKADEVWLLATDEEGVAQARRLSDHPDAERALEVLTTGEFWSAEGEDWVVADGK